MPEKKHYKFGLRKQLVLFITSLALITYATSELFIYYVHPMFFKSMDERMFTILTLFMGVIWSGILAFFAAALIVKPLKKLETAALRASQGDISRDAELPKSDDEIRSLGKAFNHMLFNLRDMVQNIETNFQETNEKVISISHKSAEASTRAESISRTIEEIAKGADQSAVSIQHTAESVEDVITIAKEVQNKANSSAETSREMVSDLLSSKEVIHSLVTGIQQLAHENQDALQAVRRLEENAQKIERIIQLVGNIAGQTNLLALNASIEAARAGEHGKGFAVVAEEVRLLADESAKAVQGISALIQTIQNDVQSVVTQISEQVETANTEAEKGSKTNRAIEEMTETVHSVASAVQDITLLVDRQMENIQTTSRQSQEVAAIAQETSAGALEVTSSAQDQTSVIEDVDRLAFELKQQAEKLKQTITQFQL
ncbi:methyl-accepting chemotaxis protein [Bacillus sp. MUM 13]|uniref:methyl-accepting chemotaxis protein n=1 Tax=Bacillus sp. MUM 13 TaxID=1678001 RepID=UPI0008F57E9D|nr:methyl-accepting chemotaxis protein [Bacillus sp. MUM 13]OIK12565.1 methyl-accepting chemotaxis protein [Bacillus sp. MUM 13]